MYRSDTLCHIKPGEAAKVTAISDGCPLQRRFYDLGLTPGTRVTCVGQSPGKNMKAYRIRGAIVAIRSEDCVGILIEKEC
jgi:ferrous iron transport protein A